MRLPSILKKVRSLDTIAEDTLLNTVMDFVNRIDEETRNLQKLNVANPTKSERLIRKLLRPTDNLENILNREVEHDVLVESDQNVTSSFSFSSNDMVEITAGMKSLVKLLTRYYEKSKILTIYRKFGKVFDPVCWSLNYHVFVPTDILDWLYYTVIIHLALNKSLPLAVRYMRKREFRNQIRTWLKIANEYKSTKRRGKM